MSKNNEKTFRVLGLDIEFPFVPYGVQKAMMNKITLTLTNKQHTLIESPTGTGKTLVLLCATLAWQKKSKSLSQPFVSDRLSKILMNERREKLLKRPCSCGRRPALINDNKSIKESYSGCAKFNEDSINYLIVSDSDLQTEAQIFKRLKTNNEANQQSSVSSHVNSDEQHFLIERSFEPSPYFVDDLQRRKYGQGTQSGIDIDNTAEDSTVQASTSDINLGESYLCDSCQAIEAEEKFFEVLGNSAIVKSKIPRIYYGARTHKQITQVIRELNKTVYRKNLRLCILSSRDRTCINRSVRSKPDINDRCQELIKNNQDDSDKKKTKSKPGRCPFFVDSNYMAKLYEQMNSDYSEDVWDIEEAAKYGRNIGACPYFGIRSLQERADITFCPYNYLLDSNIREAMNINLSNSIIIFDEAHNIEQTCTDSTSCSLDTNQIDGLIEKIAMASKHFLPGSSMMGAYEFFKGMLITMNHQLRRFEFENTMPSHNTNDHLERRIMSQQVMLEGLELLGLGVDILPCMKESLKLLRGDDDAKTTPKSGTGQQSNLFNFNQMQILDQLCMSLDLIYANNYKNLSDFRAVVTKTSDQDVQIITKSERRLGRQRDRHTFRLGIYCLNPGIAFRKIHSLAWSVIVASGTLSPIDSLKSELGCDFKNIFEGSHIISEERVYASILSKGPSGNKLNCSFKNSLCSTFQDEVGAVVHDICKVVPNGIVCFFPSYDRFENLFKRWKISKLVIGRKIGAKKIFIEKRNSTVEKFEEELSQYYETARTSGALLCAIYRGKVSEGIDFADAAARAVITIGIPYTNINEISVSLKREYNDLNRTTRPYLVTGQDWYISQAFRALNQAVGRCIRHKYDWGAVIMIDSRLNQQSCVRNISRWLRRSLVITDDYQYSYERLKDFVRARSADS